MTPDRMDKAALVTCRLLSAGLFAAFVIFAINAFQIGITKQTVYTGPVGFRLGLYVLLAVVLTATCLAITGWMAWTGRRWRSALRSLALGWSLTVVAYAFWDHLVHAAFFGH